MKPLSGVRIMGSSPRMRGTQAVSRAARPHAGIIPAYAGNTLFEHERRCLHNDEGREMAHRVQQRDVLQ